MAVFTDFQYCIYADMVVGWVQKCADVIYGWSPISPSMAHRRYRYVCTYSQTGTKA